MNCGWGDGVEKVYQTKCLQLILAISKALEKLDEGDYAAAKQILRQAGRDAAGEIPKLPLR